MELGVNTCLRGFGCSTFPHTCARLALPRLTNPMQGMAGMTWHCLVGCASALSYVSLFGSELNVLVTLCCACYMRKDMVYYSENQGANYATNGTMPKPASLTQTMHIMHLKTQVSDSTQSTQWDQLNNAPPKSTVQKSILSGRLRVDSVFFVTERQPTPAVGCPPPAVGCLSRPVQWCT